jgi:hypothetical protein
MDNLCYLTKWRLAVLKSTPPLLQRVSPAASRNSNPTAGPPLPRIISYQLRAKHLGGTLFTRDRGAVHPYPRPSLPWHGVIVLCGPMPHPHRILEQRCSRTFCRCGGRAPDRFVVWMSVPRHVAAHPHPRRRGLEHARSREVRWALRRPEPSRADRGRISEPHPNRRPRNPPAHPRV